MRIFVPTAAFIGMLLAGAPAPADSAQDKDEAVMVCTSEDVAHAGANGQRFFYEIRQDSDGTEIFYLSDPEYFGQTKTTIAKLADGDTTMLSAKHVFRFSGRDGTTHAPVFTIAGVDLDQAVIDNVRLYVWTYVAPSWTLNGKALGPIICTYSHHYSS